MLAKPAQEAVTPQDGDNEPQRYAMKGRGLHKHTAALVERN